MEFGFPFSFFFTCLPLMRSNTTKEDVDERVVADMDWMAQQQQQQSTALTSPPLVALSFTAINSSSNIANMNTFESRANDCIQPYTSEQQECLATYRNNLCNLYKGMLTQLNAPKGHRADSQQTSHSITP